MRPLLQLTACLLGCLLGCNQTLSLDPIAGFPLDYQADVRVSSSTCSKDHIQELALISADLLLGKRDEQTLVSLTLSDRQLIFDALLCPFELGEEASLCMNMIQSQPLPTTLTRAATLSDPEDGLIGCESQYASPEDLISMDMETPSDLRGEREACCRGEVDARASRLRQEGNQWVGTFSLRETPSLKLPASGRPSALSSVEESGLLALYGGETSCITRFKLSTSPKN
jgi:hypothetical protein